MSTLVFRSETGSLLVDGRVVLNALNRLPGCEAGERESSQSGGKEKQTDTYATVDESAQAQMARV